MGPAGEVDPEVRAGGRLSSKRLLRQILLNGVWLVMNLPVGPFRGADCSDNSKAN
jgi:hypothetical protein